MEQLKHLPPTVKSDQIFLKNSLYGKLQYCVTRNRKKPHQRHFEIVAEVAAGTKAEKRYKEM